MPITPSHKGGADDCWSRCEVLGSEGEESRSRVGGRAGPDSDSRKPVRTTTVDMMTRGTARAHFDGRKTTYFIEAGPIGAPGGIPDSEAQDVRFDSEAQDGQSGQLIVRPTT
jgi:hypothetical protein